MDIFIAPRDDNYEVTLGQHREDMPIHSPHEHSFTVRFTRTELTALHAAIGTVLLSDVAIYPSQ